MLENFINMLDFCGFSEFMLKICKFCFVFAVLPLFIGV